MTTLPTTPLRLLATFLVVVLTAATSSAETSPLAPSIVVGGHSQAEWSQRWWQWAASFSNSTSPVADTTGRSCHLKQDGPVWFLAGTYETRRTIRTCEVPRGKYLFFPLINYVVYPQEGEFTCARVTADAAQVTNDLSSLVLER